MNWQDPYVLIGFVGMLLILSGIWRTTSGSWRHTSVWYELDTIVGASLIIIYQLHVKAFVTLPINAALVFISFRGLSSFAERYALTKKRKLNKKLKRLRR